MATWPSFTKFSRHKAAPDPTLHPNMPVTFDKKRPKLKFVASMGSKAEDSTSRGRARHTLASHPASLTRGHDEDPLHRTTEVKLFNCAADSSNCQRHPRADAATGGSLFRQLSLYLGIDRPRYPAAASTNILSRMNSPYIR